MLHEPDELEPAGKGRQNAFKKVGERLVRVTFKEETQRTVVITATKRKAKTKGVGNEDRI